MIEKWLSWWLESWEGLLLVADVSTTGAEAIFKVNPCRSHLQSQESEDGFRTGWQTINYQQQSFSGLQLSRISFSINFFFFSSITRRLTDNKRDILLSFLFNAAHSCYFCSTITVYYISQVLCMLWLVGLAVRVLNYRPPDFMVYFPAQFNF